MTPTQRRLLALAVDPPGIARPHLGQLADRMRGSPAAVSALQRSGLVKRGTHLAPTDLGLRVHAGEEDWPEPVPVVPEPVVEPVPVPPRRVEAVPEPKPKKKRERTPRDPETSRANIAGAHKRKRRDKARRVARLLELVQAEPGRWSVRELAQELGCGRHAVYGYIREGCGVEVREGRVWGASDG